MQDNFSHIFADDFLRMEVALDVISSMKGDCIIELSTANPDEERREEIEALLAVYNHECNLIYSGDKDAQNEVIKKYSPILKAKR